VVADISDPSFNASEADIDI
jgi:rRNA-processing protein CGR1